MKDYLWRIISWMILDDEPDSNSSDDDSDSNSASSGDDNDGDGLPQSVDLN
jgi:hypothetical protein